MSDEERGGAGQIWWWRASCAAVLVASLAAIVPTLGDFGLTYDEPAYRYSQMLSGQWWERLARARDAEEIADVLAADSLLYYWPYARHGINFHPPLAGQLNLLSWELTSGWLLKDIPARRLAQGVLYAISITSLFGFIGKRCGAWAGLAAAGALLTMPRVYGQAHLIDTDTPGMVIWLLAAVCFWKGVYEPDGRKWRIAVGVLAGLGFVEKLGAVFVLVPLVGWLAAGHLTRALWKREDWRAWIDGTLMTTLLVAPLALAYAEIKRLETKLPRPQFTNLLVHDPPSWLPGCVLLIGLVVWLWRRWLARRKPESRLWGVERPALETWCAILAFGPALAWLGNPSWWRHALTRLAHYYQLSTARKGALPDIQNYYLGRIYEYSLPWESAWTLIALTVPATLLAASAVGLVWGLVRSVRGDRLPLFFLLLFATLPMLRIIEAPAHDGVRLILPCFPFLAAFAGWGTAWLGNASARALRFARPFWVQALVAATVLIPAAWQLARVHPYELSYYNELAGGTKGAWEAGFELSYWYDAFTPEVLADLNARLPAGAAISYANEQSNPVMVLQDLQALGELRGDLKLWDPADGDRFPYMWLLTHDSKASSFTRLLFAMKPWYASRPSQLDGLRVLTVADPVAVSRAWALQLLCHGPAAEPEPREVQAPEWIRKWVPKLGRLWGDGVIRVARPIADRRVIQWAEDDPEGLRQAARWVAEGKPVQQNEGAKRLMTVLSRDDRAAAGQDFSTLLLRVRPEAVYEAALILIGKGEAVTRVLENPGYRDPDAVGGYLDEGAGVK